MSRRLPPKAAAAAVLALAACTGYPKLKVAPVTLATAQAGSAEHPAHAMPPAPQTSVKVLAGQAPSEFGAATLAPAAPEATPEQIAALLPDMRVEAALPPQPLSQFVDTVFGQVLRVPYATGPGVAQRRDIVTLRGPVAVSNRSFFAMVQGTLRQYGLTVAIQNGSVQVMQSQVMASASPLFMRSRVMPETPPSSRPVVQFQQMNSVQVAQAATLLEETYPNRDAVAFAPDPATNSLVITGDARDVASAATMAGLVDQPMFAGGQVVRIQPVYWPPERLAQALVDAMTAEGFRVGIGTAGPPRDLTILPVPFASAMLLFSSRPGAMDRAVFWVRELDTLSAIGDQEAVFSYTVENTTAAELGALIAQLTTDGPLAARDATAPDAVQAGATFPVPNAAGPTALPRPILKPGSDPGPSGPVTSGRLTIDPGGNRLLFRGTRSEFEQVRALMVELDTPPRQVLVEVTIAEVTLSDDTRFGVDWFLQHELGGGDIVIDTRGSAVKEPGGLGATFTEIFSDGGRLQIALSAIAENRNLNILSTPRLVARSGSQAQILVGTDVPIITSQRAADGVQAGGDTDILQTVQYRQTGVILNMRPVVYGDDRVDIELFQEVSSQEPNRTSDIASPLILNRSVSTQLSLREGMTAVIGGLIQDNYSRNQRGVPFLKDIPLLGMLARSDAVAGTKVELLVIVTPHIIRSDEQMGAATEAYTSSLNRMLRKRGPQVYTLVPWRSVLQPPRVHGGLRMVTVPNASVGDGRALPTAQEPPPPPGPNPPSAVPAQAPAPVPATAAQASPAAAPPG